MSFQQGVSGLTGAGRNLEVIGNNVANASTVGAKSSRAEFADIYAYNMASGGTTIGLGASLASVAQQFSQGNLTTTDNPLDVAINGAGFFQLQDDNGLMQYGRNGQFRVDRDGFVSNAQGLHLVAVPMTYASGQTPGKAQPLQLPTSGVAPQVSSKVKVELNLDSRSAIPEAVKTGEVDFADSTTYNSSTSLNIYDAKGQQVAMTYFFQKTAPDSWNVYVAANGVSVATDANGKPAPASTVTFPADGKTPLTPSEPLLLDIPATGSAGSSTTTEPIAGLSVDLAGVTQYGLGFGVTGLSQDGFAPGRLTGVSINPDGVVMGSYSSGQTTAIARLELASFRNQQGLQPVGGNTWLASYASGDPVIGSPGAGNMGALQSRAVEESNVDLTNELVGMMVAQRIYQANAQTIKTQDSVMQTLVNLR